MRKSKPGKDSGQRIVDLVTGSTSGVGKHLIIELLNEGHEVRVILRNPPDESGDLLKMPPGVIPYISDITFKRESDEQNLIEACKGVDNVFHIAGATYNSKYTFNELVNINVVGTENLLNSLVKATSGSKKSVRFIFAGSVTVYGYTRKEEKLTESSEFNPKSPYSESKVMAEQVITSICKANKNINYTILRFGIFYGYDYKGPFYKVFSLVHKGKAYYVGNKGTNHLILVSQDDAVKAMILAMKLNVSKNSVYNISDGIPYTLRDIFEFVAKELNVPPSNRTIPRTVANLAKHIMNINKDEFEFLTSDRVLDISKAKADMGFQPKDTIYTEGKNLIDSYKKEVLKI
ncbi:nucleoside-diphosphate-sugar epimerase [Candidatus Mancarchaeum acidiphilum]|uniref:Nucleoside-diphosphate-sugar epimerase n=1 Tax=Candidatus Mancarchaeum acidiphilum TaxID=1920749 RepID=A0A218NMJ5_9ARCH|nr:nucleoside-diphosphate-sugar epimerase [Candidatus Mancarchaeum acidiphilum]